MQSVLEDVIDEFKKDPTYLLGAEITADYEKPVFNFLSEIPEGDELKNMSNFVERFLLKTVVKNILKRLLNI